MFTLKGIMIGASQQGEELTLAAVLEELREVRAAMVAVTLRLDEAVASGAVKDYDPSVLQPGSEGGCGCQAEGMVLAALAALAGWRYFGAHQAG